MAAVQLIRFKEDATSLPYRLFFRRCLSFRQWKFTAAANPNLQRSLNGSFCRKQAKDPPKQEFQCIGSLFVLLRCCFVSELKAWGYFAAEFPAGSSAMLTQACEKEFPTLLFESKPETHQGLERAESCETCPAQVHW